MFSIFKKWISSKPKPRVLKGLQGVAHADALFHNLIAEQRIPGLAVTVLRSGELLLEQGYGSAALEAPVAVDPQKTLFRIASISKCITGLALGRMVEQGLVGWDDSVYQHIPYYPKKRYDFTLRQLASHTAGIRGYRGKEFALNRPYSIKESLNVFQNDALLFKPGRGYLYNSFDFVVLSLAMQEAASMPFEDYVEQEVLEPLNMKNTFPEQNGPNANLTNAQLSGFYTKATNGFKKAVAVNNFYKLAGGGYLSTSSDIAKMGQAIVEGQLLAPETYRNLFESQVVAEKPTYYGLGFQVSQDTSGRSFYGHVGNSVGAYTNFFVYPKESLTVSLLANCSNAKIQTEFDEAIKNIIEDSGLG